MKQRYEATGAVVVGIANDNIINNLRQNIPGRVFLLSNRELAKMLHSEQEYIDLYTMDLEEEEV